MTYRLQRMVFRIFIAMAVLLSANVYIAAETLEMEIEMEEVCCTCNDKLSRDQIPPKTQENKNFTTDCIACRQSVKSSTSCKLLKGNLEIVYCVFRE